MVCVAVMLTSSIESMGTIMIRNIKITITFVHPLLTLDLSQRDGSVKGCVSANRVKILQQALASCLFSPSSPCTRRCRANSPYKIRTTSVYFSTTQHSRRQRIEERRITTACTLSDQFGWLDGGLGLCCPFWQLLAS